MNSPKLRKIIKDSIQEVLNEGMFDALQKTGVSINVLPSQKEKLIAMGNVLSGGYDREVSDDIKIIAAITYFMSGRKTNLFDTATNLHSKGIQ